MFYCLNQFEIYFYASVVETVITVSVSMKSPDEKTHPHHNCLSGLLAIPQTPCYGLGVSSWNSYFEFQSSSTLECDLFWKQGHCRCNFLVKIKSFGVACVCMCTLSCFSHVRLCETLWTAAHQAPLSMGFSMQEYWSGLSCPPPGDLPDPGIKPMSLKSAALPGRFFTTAPPGKPNKKITNQIYN